jgi:hypothetical protein
MKYNLVIVWTYNYSFWGQPTTGSCKMSFIEKERTALFEILAKYEGCNS